MWSSSLTFWSNKLNVLQLVSKFCFIQPVGNGFVIPKPYWLFSSNLKIFVMTLFFNILFHCWIWCYNKFYSCNLFEILHVVFLHWLNFKFGSKISVSKANLVLTDLKLPVIISSKILIAPLEVGSAIITRDISLSIQLLSVLAKLHFLGLKPYWSCMNWNLFSAISQSKMIPWAFYKSFISPKFRIFNVLYRKKELS